MITKGYSEPQIHGNRQFCATCFDSVRVYGTITISHESDTYGKVVGQFHFCHLHYDAAQTVHVAT